MTDQKNILVTGASGQVGTQLIASLINSNHYNPLPYSHKEFDITDEISIEFIFKQNIDAVINCAAYTAVDFAQSEVSAAWQTNVIAPKLLAKACANKKIPLIHFSTDYVYDNGSIIPLKETDPCHPKSIYAISKYCGEQAALYYNNQTIVIRTSWVYAQKGQNFVNTIHKLSKEKDELNIVDDQIGAPTYSKDLVDATMTILNAILSISFQKSEYGIYNYSNLGNISWYDFAKEIIRLSHSSCKLNPVSTSSFPRPAPRPNYSVFDMTKIKTVFGIEPKDWQESLKDCFKID